MKKVKLDSVLLFALIVPFIMTVRLATGETPFWLFGLIFLGMLLYIILDLIDLKPQLYEILKIKLLAGLIVVIIGSAFWSAMYVRHTLSPEYDIHDIILQQEAAIRYFLDGVNPYAATYFGTPLEAWHYSDTDVNPALYHYVMQPLYHLFALPFYWISFRTVGFFDGRMPLLFLFFALLINAGIVVSNKLERRLFLILLAFNPAMLLYTLEGRSDVYMYAFLFAGFYLLHIRRLSLASIAIACAFAVKQSAWPLFPLYVAYLVGVEGQTEKMGHIRHILKKIVVWLVPFGLTFGLIVLPFYFWDPQAFMESTVYYLSGNLETSYPISGYGIGMVLYKMGIIKDLYPYYPFTIWQAVICIPLLIVLIKYILAKPSVARLIVTYGIFLMVYWYFSRYFNNSHVGYLSMVFITAYFWPEKTENQVHKKE